MYKIEILLKKFEGFLDNNMFLPRKITKQYNKFIRILGIFVTPIWFIILFYLGGVLIFSFGVFGLYKLYRMI